MPITQAGQAFGYKKAPDALLCRPRSLSKHRAECNGEKEIVEEKEVGTALRFVNNMLPFVLIKTDTPKLKSVLFGPPPHHYISMLEYFLHTVAMPH